MDGLRLPESRKGSQDAPGNSFVWCKHKPGVCSSGNDFPRNYLIKHNLVQLIFYLFFIHLIFFFEHLLFYQEPELGLKDTRLTR